MAGNERVGVPHDCSDTAIALFFPGGDGVLLVPCHEQLLLLTGHAQFVTIEHVEGRASNQTFHLVAGFGRFLLEVDFCRALTVLAGSPSVHAVVEVAAITVHFANGRVQVEQISFHGAEHRIFVNAVLAPAVLPALALVTESPGWNDVFPFGSFSAGLLLARFIAAGFGIDAATGFAYPRPFAATVELTHGAVGLVEIDLLFGDDLGFSKCRRRGGEGGSCYAKQQCYNRQQLFHESNHRLKDCAL
ncbi:hypothetical protein D3C77_281070 [compost metagenome]